MRIRILLPGSFAAMTVHPNLLLLSRSRFHKLEPWAQGMVLAHEAVHAQQMRDHGWWRFVMRYVFSGYWRAQYEMEANRKNLKAYTDHGFIREEVIQMLLAKVRRAYFPKYWFGRAPTIEVMRAVLLQE